MMSQSDLVYLPLAYSYMMSQSDVAYLHLGLLVYDVTVRHGLSPLGLLVYDVTVRPGLSPLGYDNSTMNVMFFMPWSAMSHVIGNLNSVVMAG